MHLEMRFRPKSSTPSLKSHILARLSALKDGFQNAKHIARLRCLDRHILLLARLDRLAPRVVECGVRLRLQVRRRHDRRLAIRIHHRQAHALRLVLAEARRRRLLPGLELVLLRVEAELAEAALVAAHPEAQLVDLGAQRADAHMYELAIWVGELRNDGVRVEEVGRAGALRQQAAVHRARHAEQRVRLIDEVSAKVEERAAALRDAELALPVGRGRGLVAVKVCVELEHAAERALREQVAHGEKVRVPAAVLVHADEAAAGACRRDKRLGLGGRRHERLLGQDVLAGVERGLGEGEVVVRRGRDDDNVDGRVGEQFVGIDVVLRVGVVGRRRVAVLRAALDDGVKLELRRCGDEGDVEDLGGHAGGQSLAIAVD